jgi:high-affinity iron transporter
VNTLAFDVTEQVPPGSWYGTLLKGVFNFSPETTTAQLITWLVYLVPVLFLFFRSSTARATAG